MRGFCVPSRLIDWTLARSKAEECKSDELFLEYLLVKQAAVSHILVPTRFGLFLDMERDVRFAKKVLRHNATHADVLIRQDNIFHKCAICTCELQNDEKRPYQIALRIISIFKEGDWHYDITFSLLCRACRFTSWPRLMVLNDEDCPTLCDLIGKYGFRENVEREVLSVQEAYVCRAERVNERNLEIVQHLYAGRCYHCGAEGGMLESCTKCKTFWFCSSNELCKEFGMNRYHSRHCNFENEPLFLTKYSYFVDALTCKVDEIRHSTTEMISQLKKMSFCSKEDVVEKEGQDAGEAPTVLATPAAPLSKKASSKKKSAKRHKA